MAALTEKTALSKLYSTISTEFSGDSYIVVFTQPEITEEQKQYIWFALASQQIDYYDTEFNIMDVDINISTQTYSQAVTIAQTIEEELNKTTLVAGSGNIFVHVRSGIWFVEDIGEGKIRYRYVLPIKLRNKYSE